MRCRFRYWLARYRIWRIRKHCLKNPYANHLVARWYAAGGDWEALGGRKKATKGE